jgi:hypothetical protein
MMKLTHPFIDKKLSVEKPVKQEPVKEPCKPESPALSSKFMKKIPGATGLLQF